MNVALKELIGKNVMLHMQGRNYVSGILRHGARGYFILRPDYEAHVEFQAHEVQSIAPDAQEYWAAVVKLWSPSEKPSGHEATLREWVGEEVAIYPAPGIMLMGRLKEGYVGEEPHWVGLYDDDTEAPDGFTVDSADGFVFFRATQVRRSFSDVNGPEIHLLFPEDETEPLDALVGQVVLVYDGHTTLEGTLTKDVNLYSVFGPVADSGPVGNRSWSRCEFYAADVSKSMGRTI